MYTYMEEKSTRTKKKEATKKEISEEPLWKTTCEKSQYPGTRASRLMYTQRAKTVRGEHRSLTNYVPLHLDD